MAKKDVSEIKRRTATVAVSSTMLGQQKSRGKEIHVRPFVTDTANVSVKYGVTIPSGNYASARCDVMISCPCYVEEITDVYEMVRELVDQLIEKETKRFQGEQED